MNKRKNSRKNSDKENPDITSPLSSTLPAEPKTKATCTISDDKIVIGLLPPDDPEVILSKKQDPDLSASTDLARKKSENMRPLIDLANIKSMKKYGYCRVGASYNYAYSIHHNNNNNKTVILGVNTLYLVTTIFFVILKMSDVYLQNLQMRLVYRHQYSSDVVLAVCQTIPKSNNKPMSAGQSNKTLNCHGRTDCLPSHVNHSRCVYSEKEEVHCIGSQTLAPI